MEKMEQMEQVDNTSEFGKFRSSEALLEAYNTLEAEFTKRCQKLKATEERLKSVNNSANNPLNSTQPSDLVVATTQPNVVDESVATTQTTVVDETLVKSAKSDAACVLDAKKQIENMVSVEQLKGEKAKEVDENCAACDAKIEVQSPKKVDFNNDFNALPLELQASLLKKMESEDFIEDNILKSEKIRRAIIEDYLAKLYNGSKSAFSFLSPTLGDSVLTPVKRPKSLSEAKIIADKFLN